MRKNNREQLVLEFDNFYKDAKDVFIPLSKSNERLSYLDKLYSFNVCPGGRNGGLDERIIEIFYGNRPIEHSSRPKSDGTITKGMVIANGATLTYSRSDDGHIFCVLSPSLSENMNPPEDAIILKHIKKPRPLKALTKLHWKQFISYMEVTCIDGDPNIWQKLTVLYLRNFKVCIINSRVQDRKIYTLIKFMVKWIFTIGISGILVSYANCFLCSS